LITLDASALIALLKLEPGWEVVEQHLRASIISSVNLAETLSKYAEYGGDIDQAMSLFEEAAIEIVPASFEQAVDVSRLRLPTRTVGLSLGDRFCFALARERKLPVLTAGHIWDKVKVGVKVVRIR